LIRRTTPATSATQPAAKSIGNAGGSLRVVVSLAAVLGLIVLMYWASRRLIPRGALSAGSTRAIQVLARAPISPRQRVLLLQVGRRILVVAEGGGGGQPLSTLCEITDPDEAAALIGQIRGEQAAGPRSFASLLSSAAERFRSAESPNPQAAEEPPPPADDLAATQQQLDGLTQRVRVMARQFERA
jgi:flagellar biogenesis protein FliO